MTKSYRVLALTAVFVAMGMAVMAQRPRTIDPDKGSPARKGPTPAPAPETFKAKYEGGVLGYTKKQDGTLTFDDANRRLLFRNKHQKDVLFIPYDAVSAAYPDTHSRRPTAATIVGSVPAPYGLNIPAWFVRKKYRYLTLNFGDPDTNTPGVTSFKLENKEILDSVLNTLATKAGLTARGEGYIKKRSADQSKAANP